jgi:hypothetical protein
MSTTQATSENNISQKVNIVTIFPAIADALDAVFVDSPVFDN